MRTFTQKTVQLFAVICMVVLTAFSAKADEIVLTTKSFGSYADSEGANTFGGFGFEVSSVGNYSGIQMKKGSGNIYNTDAINFITKIEIVVTKGDFEVYEGTSENPTTLVTGTNGIYTFSEGMSYCKVKSKSGSVSNASSITITYLTTSEPTIVAPTEAVAFSARFTETETKAVAISGANLTSNVTVTLAGDHFATETTTLTAEAVMAGADIEVAFTAPEVAGEYSGTLSIASDDFETVEVALTATAIDPALEPITLVLEGGNGLSTEATSGTFVQDEVTFTYKNLYYTSYGSYTYDKGDKDGYLTNTTAMVGLSQIICTEDYKYYNTVIYVGATADAIDTKLDYTKDGDKYIYTVPTGNSYFKYVNESSYNAQVDAFEFTFKEIGETTTPAPAPASISVDATTLSLGNVKINDIIEKEIAITTTNITKDITVAISGSDDFSTNDGVYTAEEVNNGDLAILDVMFSSSMEGEYTATIAISSEEFETVEIALTATVVAEMSNNGSYDYPYTLAEARAHQGENDVWVKAVIIGTAASKSSLHTPNNYSETNLAIGVDETDFMPVALPTGDVRDALNLKENPDNLGKTVLLHGDLTAYFSTEGLKNVDDFEILNEGTTGVAQAENATAAVASVAGGIVVKAADAAMATIYTVAGAQVAAVELTAGDNMVELEQGIYLVVVDGAVAKAVIR